MKLFLILVALYFNLFEIINSKLYRIHLEDKILPYIDSSIPPVTDYFSFDNFMLEQIDDDNVQIGGYIEAIKSMDRNLPLSIIAKTQTFEQATWNDAVYRLTLPNICLEFINPQRFWYNITKLWTLDLCPTQIGDKLEIEESIVNIVYDVPSSMPIVPWRAYIYSSQGFTGFDKNKFGYGFEFQFIPIN